MTVSAGSTDTGNLGSNHRWRRGIIIWWKRHAHASRAVSATLSGEVAIASGAGGAGFLVSGDVLLATGDAGAGMADQSQSHLVTPRQAAAGNIVASAGTSDSVAGSVSLTGGATSASASGGALNCSPQAQAATSVMPVIASGDAGTAGVIEPRAASQHRCIEDGPDNGGANALVDIETNLGALASPSRVGVGAGEGRCGRHRHAVALHAQRMASSDGGATTVALKPASNAAFSGGSVSLVAGAASGSGSTDNGTARRSFGGIVDGWRWRLCIRDERRKHIGKQRHILELFGQCGSRLSAGASGSVSLAKVASASGNTGSVAVGSGFAAGGSAGTVTANALVAPHRQWQWHFNHRWCNLGIIIWWKRHRHVRCWLPATSSGEVAIASGAGGSFLGQRRCLIATGDSGAGGHGSV